MSDRNRGQHPPPKQAPPKLKAVMLEPPREVDAVAPPLVNEIVVNGGVDCVMVDFYYLSRSRFLELADSGEVTERKLNDPEIGVHRMPPTARVSMPFVVAAELVTKLFEAAAEGMVDIRDLGPGFIDRIAVAMNGLQKPSGPAGAPGPTDPGAEAL